MLSNRYFTLGGEGCPAADITAPARKRNILAVFDDRTLRARAGSCRTAQEQPSTFDTPLAQRSGFLFRVRSRMERGND